MNNILLNVIKHVILKDSYMDYTQLLRAIFSFFIPGLGQMMNGTIGRGLKFLFGFLIVWFALLILHWVVVQAVICLIIRVFCAYDAYSYQGY